MPTLPLYDMPADPRAWHRVTAPGGYEWWHFDAEDEAQGLHLAIDFFDGDPFSAQYVRAYARYRRRPTRIPPPLSRDYSRVQLELTKKAETPWRVNVPHRAGELSVSEGEIRIGSSRLQVNADGSIAISLLRLPLVKGASIVSAELLFRPLEPYAPLLRQMAGEQNSTTHFRLGSNTEWEVSGTLGESADGREQRAIRFEGRGSHTHYFGTGPIGKTRIY